MTIHIDGIVFSLQRQGGISVYFRQLLGYLESHRVDTTMTLDKALLQHDVDSSSEHCRIIKRAEQPLERYRACRPLDDAAVFHSTYYRTCGRRASGATTPSVVTVHDFIYERYVTGVKKWVHVAQKHAAIRQAQTVICISQSTREDLREFIGEIPGQTVHVIHNGAADLFGVLPTAAPAERPFVLFVGERRGYKNFASVAAAMAALPELDLQCVGGGPLRPEELGSLSLDVRRRIRHLGFVSDKRLNELYNRAVCLAYPSSYEGFGIPVIEAMRAGCPVVCIEGCKAVIEIGRDALMVAPEASGDAVVAAIERTLDPTTRSGLISRGLALAGNYTWETTHRQTLDIYAALGARVPNAPHIS